jgi:hypothetical protein
MMVARPNMPHKNAPGRTQQSKGSNRAEWSTTFSRVGLEDDSVTDKEEGSQAREGKTLPIDLLR